MNAVREINELPSMVIQQHLILIKITTHDSSELCETVLQVNDQRSPHVKLLTQYSGDGWGSQAVL